MKLNKFNHWGNYSRNIPLPTQGIEKRRAYIVGSGIAGLSAAYFLIRDAHMPAENIIFLESDEKEGGAMDGAGNAEEGFIVRGGREMETCYENFWDIFQDIPGIELGEGYSILDEYRLANDKDSNYSKSRLLHKQGKIKDFSNFGLSKGQQKELTKLVLAKKEDLDDITVDKYFSKGFLETNFWMFWRTMFAFQNWQSVLEVKLYMHRFLHLVDGLNDMTSLVFPKYNQYENFIIPLSKFLKEKGVTYKYNSTVKDLEMKEANGKKQVISIKYITENGEENMLKIGEKDIVLVTNGSMTENSTYGDNTTVPSLNTEEIGTCWNLWKNIAKQDKYFGKPEKFCGQPEKSLWESATMTLKPSALTKKVQELSVNDPYSGKTATGGIITFTDSNWVISFTCNRQPHFLNQPKDILVIWVYALLMDTEGNYTKKKMPDCTGDEILAELCYHLGIEDEFEDVKKNTIVRTAVMPYITSQFMPRAYGDRPKPFPESSKNLGFMGQFVETENDVVFTVETSVRSAKEAVYGTIGIDKVVPDISPDQYDLRNLLKAMRTMNNGKAPFTEKVLKWFLGKTYFGDIFDE